jgi:hypothetical protein
VSLEATAQAQKLPLQPWKKQVGLKGKIVSLRPELFIAM